MADTQNPLNPQAVSPVQPVVPAVPPATVVPGIQPAPPPAQISSQFLQNLQSVNPQPFQPVSPPAAPAPAPISPPPPLSTPPTPGGLPPVTPPPGGVPQEAAGFASQPAAATPSGAPTPPPPAGTGLKPAAAPSFFSNRRNVFIALGILIGVVVLGILAFMFLRPRQEAVVRTSPSPGRRVELTYWGLWEPPEVMEALIADYKTENPNVDIEYVQQKSDQYRQRLQAAIADGSGPDIFRFHNTWVPMVASDLAPAPSGTMTAQEIQQNYYPIMAKELVQGADVLGVPLMYEGLALLYNQSMLEAANAQPPGDWEQVRTLASQLAVRNGDRLERGGIALGTTGNVDAFSDILGLMLLQNSAQPGNPTNENAQHALEFYTIFSRSDKVWDDTMPSSTLAFANEQVAMVLEPSWRIFEIQRTNPNLKFGVTNLPQLGGQKTAWASYWVEGVSRASRNSAEAWKFLAWLSQPEQLRRFHTQATSVRGFGELYPRVDMAQELADNALVSPYLEDALYADSWFLASNTHDEGVNDQLIQYYADAVNEMNRTGTAQQALQNILPGIEQVLARYNIGAEHVRPEIPGSTQPVAPEGAVSIRR